ncbi:MAG: threonine synthase [Haloferacaceae archaeon]
MNTSEAFRGLACTGCGERYDADEPGRCPACEAPLDPVYDYDAVASTPEALSDRPSGSMWRYAELLPFAPDHAVSASEGATPVVDAPRLADELGVNAVLVKDEGRNPTGTVYDRGMALAVTAARDRGLEPLALASPGNSGQSAAAYAGRAGLRSYAFVPSRAPFPNKAMVNVHGGEMRVVGGRYPAAEAALHEDLKTDWHSLQEFTTPYRHEGAKTVAYELADQLDWSVPDAVVVPAGTGEVVVGLAKGFRELRELGYVDEVAPIYAAQPDGCAPVVAALENDAEAVEPWDTPDTICGELEIPDPAGGDLALAAVRESGGAGVSVDDEDALASAVTAAQHEAVEMGASAGVAAAGAWDLREAFDADDTVVLLNTEAGAKSADLLRSHLMGQGV